jgi:anti-sigma factor RsiW
VTTKKRMKSSAHERYVEDISLYVDRRLGDGESAKLFAHLSRCAECRSYLKSATHVHSHIADEPLEEVPDSLDRRVLDDVAAASAPKEHDAWYAPIWFARISIPLPAAASILFLIIVGSLLFSPILAQPPERQPEVPAQLISKIPQQLQQLTVAR